MPDVDNQRFASYRGRFAEPKRITHFKDYLRENLKGINEN